MKSAILPFVFLFTFFAYSQDSLVKPDLTILKAAKAYSKGGNLVVLVIAGREFNAKSNTEITELLKRITSNIGLRLDVYIQRTEKRNSSSYLTFKDGKTCSDKTDRSGLPSAISNCLRKLSGSIRDPE